jgi:hypothetical protein
LDPTDGRDDRRGRRSRENPARWLRRARATDGSGRNISTSSQSLKHRKYLTTEETEAAATALAQSKGGARAEVVRDIRTMPMAMSRLERAIAGRELVNQVKAFGLGTGEDTVISTPAARTSP